LNPCSAWPGAFRSASGRMHEAHGRDSLLRRAWQFSVARFIRRARSAGFGSDYFRGSRAPLGRLFRAAPPARETRGLTNVSLPGQSPRASNMGNGEGKRKSTEEMVYDPRTRMSVSEYGAGVRVCGEPEGPV